MGMENLLDDLFARIVEARAFPLPATPLDYSPVLSKALGCEIFLKCEHLQPTGSFKIRGAANKVRLMGPSDQRKGVTTASTGNHGKAVAHAARAAGVAAPSMSPPARRAARRRALARWERSWW
jgi:threonine dehydratase